MGLVLLEPFLLPSLIAGLGWAARKLWEVKPSAPYLDYILPLVTCLVKPASLSPEASALHETVLTITAYPLERALAHVQKLHPRRRDIDPLLNVLRPQLHQVRSGAATHTELETWSTTRDGGLFAALPHSLQALINWSSAALAKQDGTAGNMRQTTSGAAPNYTHRLVLACVRNFGATSTLSVLISEAIKSMSAGTCPQEVALDVLTAIVCAPVASSARSTMGLRRALELMLEDAYGYSIGKHDQQPDITKAEFIIRLSRRVETQSPVRQLAQQTAAEVANAVVNDGVAADMMMGLEGNPDLATGGLEGPPMGAAAAANEVLEGMLKDVDSHFMDTDDPVDLFDLT